MGSASGHAALPLLRPLTAAALPSPDSTAETMGVLEALRTSSSRREIRSENRVGCLSGIFHFLSRQHNRSLKRLTSAKKTENSTVTITLPPPPPPTTLKTMDAGRRTCETTWSPTIPLPPTVAAIPDSPRRPPTVVARLMGLEEDTPAPSMAATPPEEDKRQELLHALEKCDEDLRALRRIIEAVRANEAASPVVSAARRVEPGAGISSKERCDGGDQPSPVSVLEAISSPRSRDSLSPNGKCTTQKATPFIATKIPRPSPTSVLFVDSSKNKNFDDPNTLTILKKKKKKPYAKLELLLDASVNCAGGDDNNKVTLSDDAQSCSFDHRKVFDETPKCNAIVEITQPSKGRGMARCRRWPRRSRATAKRSVGERWEDRFGEVENLGVLVELDILWEMVEELVVDMLELCWNLPSRSFESGCRCRKSLCF
ncbi:hypothetical protein ZIOFF_063186 [Zingiber officinale]|uniref:DUF3741 domain-containing protein n=1 Tax=Zingiber officinale TaxID=94328 RepID=A0A8J5F5Z6_ZINOF|nr:hypothetical protein ZIOFF_063185 [Zingiber officinale]KAG6479716.1 hypothetical protein ZIOFF_063186 [Zingiber officinale]